MDLKEAIRLRHSVRQYKDEPISEEHVSRLNEIIKQCNIQSGLNMQLICNDPECFDVFLAHYGKFENAVNYIALIAKKSIDNREELAGYYGQRIVLEAQMMGLNTCWVAGTYGKKKCKADIADDEQLICVIAIGYGKDQGKPHLSKSIDKFCDMPVDKMPDWFREGVEAAMLAPTAINQQKFKISLVNDEAVIEAKRVPMAKIDLGIVRYNFEVYSSHKTR
ncbi:MAG: nitroreductase family protein [Lachnospiraceae bacterium]|nr:nitroreductase family protein [Lachnospiraceae bacterium]MBP5745408.1 nitroreductase family protein [Lachnospiraceae bacterium]